MKMKLVAFVLAIVLVLAVFSGCAKDEPKPTEPDEQVADEGTPDAEAPAEKPEIVLSRWAGPHADDQKTVFAQYDKADLIVDDIDYGNLKQKQILSLSASADADYDLVWVHPTWLAEYIENEWILPLNDLIEEKGVDLSIYGQGMLDSDTVDGQLYGIPTFAQTLIITYNKEWFEREGKSVPATVDELIETAKYFKEQGTGIAIPAKQGSAAVGLFNQLLFSASGDYFDADGKVDLVSEAALYAADVYDQLCMYAIEGSTAWHHDEVSAAVREEIAPFGICITGLAYQDTDPELSKIVDKVDYAPIPGRDALIGQMDFWTWSIAANSDNIDAAFDALMWITSEEVEKEQALMNYQLTNVSALAEDPEVTSVIPFLPAASATLADGKLAPTSAAAAQIKEELIVSLSEIATTDTASADIMAQLQEKVMDLTNN